MDLIIRINSTRCNRKVFKVKKEASLEIKSKIKFDKKKIKRKNKGIKKRKLKNKYKVKRKAGKRFKKTKHRTTKPSSTESGTA